VQLAVESPKLYRVVSREKAVQVEEVVSAGMVMLISGFVVILVPNVSDLLQRFRPPCSDSLDQPCVHGFAISQPFGFYLQSFVKKVVLRSDDIDEVPYAVRGVVRSVKVDMDAAFVVRKSASLAKFPYQFLQGFDVLGVCKDRADQFAFIYAVRAGDLPVPFGLRRYARVAHNLPFPAVLRGDFICAICSADVAARSV
jgi:hypothetical protein